MVDPPRPPNNNSIGKEMDSCSCIALAKEAEGAGMWWQAALRWNAFGLLKTKESGIHAAGNPFFKLAVAASAKTKPALVSNDGAGATGCTQFDLDTFDLHTINFLFKVSISTRSGTSFPSLRESVRSH